MQPCQEFLRRYLLAGGVDNVAGWLGDGAISITLAMNFWQRAHRLGGDVAEIGVHHGRFFIVLKNTCAADELAFAIDVFGDQHLNPDGSGRGDRAIFEANLAQHSDNKGVVTLQKDSLSLRAADLSHGGGLPNIRLFSVDGSHTSEHTLNDLRIASESLAPGGVVILDDYLNPAWPGVQEGFHKFMFENRSRFAVLGYGDNKMIICRVADHGRLIAFLKIQAGVLSRWHKSVLLHGREAIAFRMKTPKEIFGEGLTMNYGLLPRSELLCRLLDGWGKIEAGGVWSIDEYAELELNLDGAIPAVELIVQPFLPPPRRARGLAVLLRGEVLAERQLVGAEAVTVELPRSLKGPAILALMIERPERPADFGGSDVRRLGLFLTGVKKW